MKEVYLDNSATTKVCDKAAKKILYMLTENYGNPSSLHLKGIYAENELEKSRKIIADKLCCKSNEIFFTSGATESNNLAILGAANKLKRFGNKIISTNVEHSSVLGALNKLESQGFEIIYLPVDKYGIIKEDDVFNAIDKNTILISMMLVNNEIGNILSVEKLKYIAKSKGSRALIHSDAVQAFGKIDFSLQSIGVDLLTITAHKMHGPKGCGAIYIKNGLNLPAIMFGGEQEKGIRPGTESTALIAGFAEAVNEFADLNKKYGEIKLLKDYLINNLNKIENITINSPQNSVPYILNFSVIGIKSETLLNYLAEHNVFVSSGSACAKGKKSHVLLNMGFADCIIDSAIRVSFSRYNTADDIDILIDLIKSAVKRFRR